MRKTRSAVSVSAESAPRTSQSSTACCASEAVHPQPARNTFACSPRAFQAAVFYRFADSNPVRELPPAQRPRPERKEAAYFENSELPRLFAHLKTEPYRSLCLVALKTGMRQGELVALRWSDVDLDEAVARVRSSFTGGTLGTPKNRDRRDVDLTTDVVGVLGRLRANHDGIVEDLIFPGENGQRFISAQVLLRRHLYPAMEAAGIWRVGPYPREAHVSQLPTHIREACTRERGSDHLAFASSGPFVAQGDDRHLWALGACGAQTPGRENGRRLSGLTLCPY
jgi:integrase